MTIKENTASRTVGDDLYETSRRTTIERWRTVTKTRRFEI